jgi:hypothetical protein
LLMLLLQPLLLQPLLLQPLLLIIFSMLAM